MNIRLQLALWSAAAVFGLAYSESDAAGAKQVAKSAANQNFSQVLTELHQAKVLLDHANHTYNGHRAKADHEITKAIHVLHHEHHKKGTTTNSAAKGAHKSEPQQVSDTQLRQAEKLVRAAMLELSRHQGEKTQHAHRLLQEAIREIELAIHLHHKHHQNQVALKKA